MSYDNLPIMHSFFVGVLKNVNKKDEKKNTIFHLSFWLHEREREQENDHVSMRSLIILLFHRKLFLSVWSQSGIEFKLSENSIKTHAALLLFLSSQSNRNVIFTRVCNCFFSRPRSCRQKDKKWKTTIRVSFSAEG